MRSPMCGAAAMSKAGQLESMRSTIGRDLHVIMTGILQASNAFACQEYNLHASIALPGEIGSVFHQADRGPRERLRRLHDVKRE